MTNLLYIAPETATKWTDAGNTPDEALDLGGLAADAVAMGSFLDLGATARAQDYNFELVIDGFATAPIVNETVTLYFSFSNATTGFDGAPTTDPTTSAEGTMTVAQLKNLFPVDACTVVTTTAGDALKITGVIRITSQYVSPVVHNDTVDALKSASDFHRLTLTPVPLQSQDAP